MSRPNKTYLEALEEKARLQPDAPLFWIPHNVEPEKPVSEWRPMTFAQFHAAVSTAKQFYEAQGTKLSIPKGSVIGIWLSGNLHTDPIQALGLSAAGFTVQLFSLYYSHSAVVFELLVNSGAKALVVDSCLPGMPDLVGCPVAVVDLAKDHDGGSSEEKFPASLAPQPYTELKDDIAFIFHSSGSTARIPKLIPRRHSDTMLFPGTESEMSVKIGNFNHPAAMYQLLTVIFNGGSICIPSSLAFSVDELENMIRYGLARLTQLTTLLVPLLQRAQSDPNVFSIIKSLRGITCGGTPFPTDLAGWCHSAGLPIRNAYANSECGFLMASTPFGNPALLKPDPGLLYNLLPYETEEDEAKLVELMVLAGWRALPHPSLLAPDGNFYTGDLFEPVGDGYYLYRGRKNDWIMTGVGHICDTKSIEDAVKELCQDVVFDCVAVGSGRRSPALLVEPTEHVEWNTIPRIITERLAPFNQKRFPHERLDDPRLVLVVDRGALPRTAAKGNIRRQGSEELFLNELNEMYNALEPLKPGVY